MIAVMLFWFATWRTPQGDYRGKNDWRYSRTVQSRSKTDLKAPGM
jgi:hypothetical protein